MQLVGALDWRSEMAKSKKVWVPTGTNLTADNLRKHSNRHDRGNHRGRECFLLEPCTSHRISVTLDMTCATGLHVHWVNTSKYGKLCIFESHPPFTRLMRLGKVWTRPFRKASVVPRFYECSTSFHLQIPVIAVLTDSESSFKEICPKQSCSGTVFRY